MMGSWQKQTELWVEPVNVGKRIPEDHLLRKINKVLDLGFAREEVAQCYGRNGQVSVDPVIILKLMLLLFLDNVRSERELMRVVPLRLDYLWFLGYGLEDEVPHHSVLSKARRRWGSEIFRRLFVRTVEQCLDAGLIEGSKLHVDASLIAANASRNSVIQIAVEQELSKLDEPEAQPEKTGAVNGQRRSTTDPDSSVIRHQHGKPTPSYKNHRALDDKSGVITAVQTTTGAVDEARELVGLLEAHEVNTGRAAKVAVADSRYGNSANFIALAKRKVRAHVADLRSRMRNVRSEGIYEPARFSYDKRNDQFICPAGQVLSRHHFHAKRGYYEYRAARGVCATCSLRSLCTRDKSGRTLKRYADQELLDRARKQSHSRAARLDRKKRQWFQERNFGEAAVSHGFKRARWRGLMRQSIQDLLIAAIQNLRILARKGSFDTFSPIQTSFIALLRILERLPLFYPQNIKKSLPRFFNNRCLA